MTADLGNSSSFLWLMLGRATRYLRHAANVKLLGALAQWNRDVMHLEFLEDLIGIEQMTFPAGRDALYVRA